MKAALAFTLFTALSFPQGDAVIQITVENQDTYCDVRARAYPVHKLMKELCEELGDLELRGFEDVTSSPEVSVSLKHRPLAQTIDYILGSVGMSGTVTTRFIEVKGALPPFPEPDDARGAARVAYLTALRFFPESEEAPQARMELASLALDEDQPQRAIDHYLLLLEDYPGDELAGDARMRAGRLLVELENWDQGEAMFREVADVEIKNLTRQRLSVIAEARRELARCVLHRGQPRQALFMLLGLDNAIPPVDSNDRAIRLYLLAQAQLDLGNHIECMRYLDQAQRAGRGVISEFEGLDLRARAMELAGRQIEAAMGWLRFSHDQPDDLKSKALVRAAQLALSVEGEELSVLFVHKLAEQQGIGDALLPMANEARARLGLDSASYLGGTPMMRLRRAEKMIISGLEDEASDLFASMELDVWSLSPTDRLRFAVAYAPLLETRVNVDSAIGLLRDIAGSLESTDNRSQLYTLAWEIYERHERFDEAAAALGGQL
jgi:tetratricopeptide (TPR) repeat protein